MAVDNGGSDWVHISALEDADTVLKMQSNNIRHLEQRVKELEQERDEAVSVAAEWSAEVDLNQSAAVEAQAQVAALEAREATLTEALRTDLRPLVDKARRLADNKNLAAAEVFRAVDNVRMWLDAALAVEDDRAALAAAEPSGT